MVDHERTGNWSGADSEGRPANSMAGKEKSVSAANRFRDRRPVGKGMLAGGDHARGRVGIGSRL